MSQVSKFGTDFSSADLRANQQKKPSLWAAFCVAIYFPIDKPLYINEIKIQSITMQNPQIAILYNISTIFLIV